MPPKSAAKKRGVGKKGAAPWVAPADARALLAELAEAAGAGGAGGGCAGQSTPPPLLAPRRLLRLLGWEDAPPCVAGEGGRSCSAPKDSVRYVRRSPRTASAAKEDYKNALVVSRGFLCRMWSALSSNSCGVVLMVPVQWNAPSPLA